MRRRLGVLVAVMLLVLIFVFGVAIGPAFASITPGSFSLVLTFIGASSSSCGTGAHIGFSTPVTFGGGITHTQVATVTDGKGTVLYSQSGPSFPDGTYTSYGSFSFSTTPAANPITATIVFDGVTYKGSADNPCLPPAGSPGVPGCDVLMPISNTSVVGTFVQTTPTYWTPGQPTNPLITIPAGKTAWVLDRDPTGQYYEIVWVCSLLWVPVDTMGPNYDDVWMGRPLPGGATVSTGTSGSAAGQVSPAVSGGGSAGRYFPVNSAPVNASTYVVQRGDNLFRIALHFGVDLNKLASVNGITDIRRIYVGQVLNIAAAR